MKHLKGYKIFESNDNDLIGGVLDIYSDFLDAFNLTESPHSKNYYTNGNIYLGIRTDLRFGEGVKVVFANGSNGGYLIKEGPSSGFSGIQDKAMRVELEKAHNRCMEHFGFTDVVLGSFYAYQSGGFSITYYTKSSFIFDGKEFDPQYLCGEDCYVRELPLLKGYVYCKSSHDNIIDMEDKDGNLSMFCLYGGSDSHYYNPISIMSGRDCDEYGYCLANSPREQWVTKQWSNMCTKYKIPVSKQSKWKMTRRMKEGDPTAYEFMDYLALNQEDINNYKKLPYSLKKKEDRW